MNKSNRLNCFSRILMVFMCTAFVFLSIVGCKEAGPEGKRIHLDMVVLLSSSIDAGDKNLEALFNPFAFENDSIFLIPEKVDIKRLDCPDDKSLYTISDWKSIWVKIAEISGEVSRARIMNDWENYLKKNQVLNKLNARCSGEVKSGDVFQNINDNMNNKRSFYVLSNNGFVKEQWIYGEQRPKTVKSAKEIWEDVYKVAGEKEYKDTSIVIVYDAVTIRPDMSKMIKIEAGPYEISESTEFLRGYLKMGRSENTFHIKKPFYIQAGEVTVGEFKTYSLSLNQKMRKEVKAELERNLDKKPVEFLSWDMANDYAKWLSSATGQSISLPTVKQWAAAVVLYAESHPVLKIRSIPMNDLRANPDHLVGNLREWSLDDCRDGKYHLMGESENIYFSAGQNCAIKEWKGKGIGFRLVLNNVGD